MLNAFTVDVEDYFQVSAFERQIDRSRWDSFECRVVANTRRLLELLSEKQVKATFFVLGWIGERYPLLVREIHALGHEIGSHSYWHRLVYEQTPEQFREDLRRSKHILEDVTGQAVTCYRAPSFSITEKSRWALEVLVEEGIKSDSSIFPVKHDRYGMSDCTPDIHTIQTPAGPLLEFPMTAVKLGRLSLPIGGGGYFRLYPYAFTQRLLHRVNRVQQRPFMFYIHPWEVDPDQPRVQGISRLSKFRHYVNLRPTMAKLSKLLGRFHFDSMHNVVNASSTSSLVAPSLN